MVSLLAPWPTAYMPGEYPNRETQPQENRANPGIGYKSRRPEMPPQVIQCSLCSQVNERASNDSLCEVCGSQLTLSSYAYSGESEEIITGHEGFHMKPHVRNVEERRHPRVSFRNAKACIKTEQAPSVIVDVVNMSRGGACFNSAEQFRLGAEVFLAVHYIEGGQNIFQNGRIVRLRHKPSGMLPTEYAVEFSPA